MKKSVKNNLPTSDVRLITIMPMANDFLQIEQPVSSHTIIVILNNVNTIETFETDEYLYSWRLRIMRMIFMFDDAPNNTHVPRAFL
jgi:hypothetical protein